MLVMPESMVFHCDRAPIKSFEKTPEGFLNYVAPIARVGWLTYRNLDGTERKEYVSADMLRRSAHTFKMKPNTFKHPPGGLVTPENAKQYQVGMTGHGVYFDNDFLWLTGALTDAATIKAVESGEAKEISCGYTAKVVPKGDGTYEQVDRVGNHVAVVPRGRAGAEVAFRFDSEDAEAWTTELVGGVMKVKIDNKEFEVDDAELAVAITGLVGKYDATEREKGTLTAKIDALEGEKTALAVRVDEAEKAKLTDEIIAQQIEERQALWMSVAPAMRADNADFKPDLKLTPLGIKALYLKTKHSSINLDGKSEAFIDGLWEGLKPSGEAPELGTTKTDALFDSLNYDSKDTPTDQDDAIAKARKKRMKTIEENSTKVG